MSGDVRRWGGGKSGGWQVGEEVHEKVSGWEGERVGRLEIEGGSERLCGWAS